jgi:hypothetical protein
MRSSARGIDDIAVDGIHLTRLKFLSPARGRG